MRIPLLFAAAGLLTAAAAPDVPSRSAFTLPQPRDGWFVCDSLSSPLIAFVGRPDEAGQTEITLIDTRTHQPRTASYALGRADPGAGQVYYALTRAGEPAGQIHAFNPGMYDPAKVTLPPVTSMQIDGRALECRWIADAQAIGATGRRSFTISREGGTLVYRSHDFDKAAAIERPDGVQRTSAASVTVSGGREQFGPKGARRFVFAGDRYSYVVTLPCGNAGATLAVLHNGAVAQSEPIIGYTLALGPHD